MRKSQCSVILICKYYSQIPLHSCQVSSIWRDFPYSGSSSSPGYSQLMAEPSNSGGIQAPEKFKYKVKAGPSLMLEGFGGEGVTYPTTTVTLTIEDKSYQMNVAVAARSTLKGCWEEISLSLLQCTNPTAFFDHFTITKTDPRPSLFTACTVHY